MPFIRKKIWISFFTINIKTKFQSHKKKLVEYLIKEKIDKFITKS
jgi:hypothetical protein